VKGQTGGEGMVPLWITTMRNVAMETISEEDVKAIVVNQVKAAKKGDKNAIKFVFDQVLGGTYAKGATFIQNNFSGSEPNARTKALPGSKEKVGRMRRRLAAGQSAFSDVDAKANLD